MAGPYERIKDLEDRLDAVEREQGKMRERLNRLFAENQRLRARLPEGRIWTGHTQLRVPPKPWRLVELQGG